MASQPISPCEHGRRTQRAFPWCPLDAHLLRCLSAAPLQRLLLGSSATILLPLVASPGGPAAGRTPR